MALTMRQRINGYAREPNYCATLEYYRDSVWTDMTDRLLAQMGDESGRPIRVTRGYRQQYTCALMLDNTDGLLTPTN